EGGDATRGLDLAARARQGHLSVGAESKIGRTEQKKSVLPFSAVPPSAGPPPPPFARRVRSMRVASHRSRHRASVPQRPSFACLPSAPIPPAPIWPVIS